MRKGQESRTANSTVFGTVTAFLATFSVLVLPSLLLTQPVRASDDLKDQSREELRAQDFLSPRVLALPSASEIFNRSQAVLSHFGVPTEANPQSLLNGFDSIQSEAGIRAMLPFIDAKAALGAFSQIETSRFTVFQDRVSKEQLDFELKLRPSTVAAPANEVLERIELAARNNPEDHPLAGLKIALDPGHMGGDLWDVRTGKYIRDRAGHKISEGVINLQTALLLERSLEALGANVQVTRKSLGPVTDLSFERLAIHESGLRELRDESLNNWFQRLIASAPAGQILYKAFEKSNDYQRLFSTARRGEYFDTEDLQARVDAFQAFDPDITLIIHYDVSAPANDPHGLNPGAPGSRDSTKVYVPGAFDSTEIATRDDRAQLTMHLADEAAWRGSVRLGHEILASIETRLKLPPDRNSPGIVKSIEPGLFARNLYVLKKHLPAVTAYVECLYYNDKAEFAAFLKANHPMTIDGQSYPYSDRAAQVADALKEGVLSFVRSQSGS
jgi:N-acetylmuramoyl-L-alanine amidase